MTSTKLRSSPECIKGLESEGFCLLNGQQRFYTANETENGIADPFETDASQSFNSCFKDDLERSREIPETKKRQGKRRLELAGERQAI